MAKITQKFAFNKKMLSVPITHASLIMLGYTEHPCDYYCPPNPAHCGMYRIGVREQLGQETTYYIYLTDVNSTRVRDIKTLEQLNNIHKGFCDADLFYINNY